MNDVIKTAIEVAEAKRDELLQNAANDVVKVKLRNLNDVCAQLVVTGRQRLTVPSVIATYAVRYPQKDQSIAESSIRNKRSGANPYQLLYRAWEDVADVVLGQQRRAAPVSGDIIDIHDVGAIADPTVRHQVRLLINQNRSLKSQIDILKQVRGAPVIRLAASNQDVVLPEGLEPPPLLSESEFAALADFVSERRLVSRGLKVGDNGELRGRDGKDLSDPGLMDALRKIVERAG